MFLLNPIAIVLTIVTVGISFLIFTKVEDKKDKFSKIGSFAQSLNFIAAFTYPIFYLADTSDVDVLGAGIAISLCLALWGAIANLVFKLMARFSK